MHNLQVETHIQEASELPRALASHILTTCLSGRVAVVCEHPEELMNQVKEEWHKLTLNKSAHYRKNITFTADSPFNDTQATVSFSTTDEYKLLPPICRTLYVTCQVERKDMYMITSWMQPRSSIVIYKL